ncbi:MAG: hypothetical protein NVS2B16_00350 [Chloroflexota bacterium]
MKSALSALLALALCPALVSPRGAFAASQPRLSISPQPAHIGKKATIVGFNLKANRYYTFLIAAPRSSKPGTKALIQTLGKTDASGHLRVRVQMPIVVQCGRVMLYATAARATVSTAFILRGCKASPKSTAPPPPPAPRKKHRS